MLTALAPDQNSALVAWQNDFVNGLLEDYQVHLKNGIAALGIRSLCYDENEHTLIISNTETRRVHLINLLTGQLRWYDHHEATVRHILKYQNEIITSSWDGTVRVVNFNTLSERLMLTERYMGRSPFVTLSPDARYLFSFSYDLEKDLLCQSNIVRKWSYRSGNMLQAFSDTGFHKSGTRSGVCIPIDDRLYVISNSGFLNVFHINSGRLLKANSIAGDFRTMCMVPAFRTIIASDVTGHIYLYNLLSDRLFASYRIHWNDITCIKVHPGKPDTFFTCSFDGYVKIWQLPDVKCLQTIEVDHHELWSFTFIRDLLVVGSTSGYIYFYDISDLSNVFLKGRMFLSDPGYALFLQDSKQYYSNDISILNISRKQDEEIITGKHAEYLLNLFNSKKMLHELFGQDDEFSGSISTRNKMIRQIPEILS